jgi:hypothetical protein
MNRIARLSPPVLGLIALIFAALGCCGMSILPDLRLVVALLCALPALAATILFIRSEYPL